MGAPASLRAGLGSAATLEDVFERYTAGSEEAAAYLATSRVRDSAQRHG